MAGWLGKALEARAAASQCCMSLVQHCLHARGLQVSILDPLLVSIHTLDHLTQVQGFHTSTF